MKLISTVIFLLSSSILIARPDTPDLLKKNTISIGGFGNLEFSATPESSNAYRQPKETDFSISINPSFNIFVATHFELGISLGYFFGLNQTFYSYQKYTTISHHISIGPSIKYYFKLDEIYPYVGLRQNIALSSSIYDSRNNPIHIAVGFPELLVGGIFQIKDNFYLNAFFDYTVAQYNIQLPQEMNYKKFTHIIMFYLGVTKYFGNS